MVVVVVLFQTLVFRQPLPNLIPLVGGLALVIVGLTLFVFGLEIGLFPIGESMAHDFARKGSLGWLIAFAFSLGFGTTFAEPALIAVANKAAQLAAVDALPGEAAAIEQRYALTLRMTVAVAVGVALIVGVLRIALGWKIHRLFIASYLLVLVLTPLAPSQFVAVAYDSGGVTTSTITVPLTAALGVGLASSIKGRNPLLDGFGLIAFASVTPIVFVLLMGIVWS